MGGTISKVDEDKALLLCRERRSHVRQALDGRCSLAEAHIAYIHALANTGMALGKLVDPEPSIDSSLYNFTSTSGGTQYPITSTDKSVSQFSNSCPSPSQRADTLYSFSPTASSISSERLHVNCMKSNMDFSTTVQEKPPVSVTATFTPSPNLDQPPNSNFPSTPPWDYFGLFHPIYNRFSLQDGRETATHVSDVSSSVDHITRLREEEGIPDLEEEIDKSPVNGKSDYVESSEDDDFDHPSSEPLVQIYKNRTETLDLELIDRKLVENADSRPTVQTGEETATVEKNDDGADDDMDQDAADQTPAIPNISSMSPPPPSPSTDAAVPTNESLYSEKETILENKNDPNKDFLSNIKEIEQLFRKASESGKEVPMMLEGNTVNFRPSLPEIQVHRSNALPFLSPFFVCFRQGTYNIKEPISNDMKYLTWHRSTSSISTSSHVPLHNHLRDGVNDSGSSHFSSMCMNSGSHASTLDRLYAWERKLYDEVKASGIVRKEYDSKCKRLRELDSRAKQLDFRGENSSKIDRTRAAVKDLHSRIGVAIHRIDSISKTIEKLRDSELQPQLEELIGGLTRMWKTMVECHTKQLDIISTLNSNGNPNITMQSEMNRQSALVLEYELNSLCLSFTKWISSHKVYLHSINQWLHRCCVFPERPKSVRRRNQSELSHWKENSPPIYTTCGDWLEELDKLPVEQVEKAIKALATHLMPHHYEKSTGDPHLSFSLSRKTDISAVYSIGRTEASPVNWSIDFDKLQNGLNNLINQLTLFSEDSVTMYEKVQVSIIEAHKRYQIHGTNQKERSR